MTKSKQASSDPGASAVSFARFLAEDMERWGRAELNSLQTHEKLQMSCRRCGLVQTKTVGDLLSEGYDASATLNDIGNKLKCRRAICGESLCIRQA